MTSESVQEALSALRALGSVDEMQALAEQGLGPARRPKGNSHIHLPPNFSAFESVQQAVDLAAEQGVGVLGVSNYYDYDVYGDFVARARVKGIFPLFGLEIIALIDELVRSGVLVNDPGNPGKTYICGKGITAFDEMTPRAAELLGIIRDNDAKRMAEMTDRLERIFAAQGIETGLTAEGVIDVVTRRHGCDRKRVYLQERHIAMAFQRALFELVEADGRLAKLQELFGASCKAASGEDEVAIQNEIRSHLLKAGKPAFVTETFVSLDQARELILELGGIPAYPTLADGASPICEYEDPVEKLIDNIRGLDVHAAEFIPIRNRPDVLARYVKAMRSAGLVITAGTEHNTLTLLGVEPTCLDREPVPEAIKDIFWEGTCVVAAHQFLVLHGRCGYVDERGGLNPAYETVESRIDALARLGAAVIRKYYDAM